MLLGRPIRRADGYPAGTASSMTPPSLMTNGSAGRHALRNGHARSRPHCRETQALRARNVGELRVELMEVEDADAHHGLFTVALPETIGRTIAGIARHLPSILRSTVKPAASISSTVARLQRQPSANRRHGFSSRSCQAASLAESARTCSRNRRRPPGLSMRLISSMTTSGRSTVHSTSVETTVSTEPSGTGAPRRARRGRSPCACGGGGLLQPFSHRGRGLGEDQLVEVVRVVGQVQPGPTAHFERPAARHCEEVAPMLAHPAHLACPEDGVVDGGERRPHSPDPAGAMICSATCVMSATVVDGAGHTSPRSVICRRWPNRVIAAQRRPSRLASATAAARDPLPSLRLMFATWRCTV